MQEIIIKLIIPDGIQFAVDVVNNGAVSPPAVAKPSGGPSLTQLKDAFAEAFKRVRTAGGDTKVLFDAIGCENCMKVPEAEYASAIEKLKGV